ncbi:DUF4189 domain-containing protein [Xanthomonas sacchari]|uniref:DUF4189 domain-containing protein n=1 Tax=Xanthomonas sacchari TaxID=56458 RepID=UPI0009E34848|nr:DUF4189 domain-containing protein [Xanthomonas sacchari]
MKITLSITLIAAMCLLPLVALSQTRCPVGVQAGSSQCLPDDENSGPARPTGEWIKTWGALVSSNQGHGAWTSKGKFIEDEAVQDALGRCKATGVSDCNVDSTYFNQCVAVVSSVQRELSISKGPSESIAKKVALKDCQRRGNSQCAVEFSDCTDPIFKKY